MFHKQNGNALLYILIAVMLLAILTYTIMGEQRGQQQNQLSDSRIKLLASDLISHANSAEMAFKQMEMFGVEADQVLFDLPGTVGYSANVTRQLYHPSGGGLSLMQNLDSHIIEPYWFTGPDGWNKWTLKNTTNVDWTPSALNDATYSIGGISEELCSKINNQLVGSSDIPTLDPFDWKRHFLGGHTSDANFTAAECANCVGKKAYCVQSPTALNFHLFYNIIGSR
jgi:hypothetical protein